MAYIDRQEILVMDNRLCKLSLREASKREPLVIQMFRFNLSVYLASLLKLSFIIDNKSELSID